MTYKVVDASSSTHMVDADRMVRGGRDNREVTLFKGDEEVGFFVSPSTCVKVTEEP
jgi:hypothetical protein